MSLINEVLRKLDQGPNTPGAGQDTGHLRPAPGGGWEGPGRWAVLGAVLFLAGVGAGFGGWWMWSARDSEPGSGGAGTVASSGERGGSAVPAADARDRDRERRAAAEAGSGPGSGAGPGDRNRVDPAPEEQASGEQPGQEAPLELEVPPLADKAARVRATPPPRDSRAAAGGSARPPLKEPRADRLKVALVPEGEQRPEAGGTAGAAAASPAERNAESRRSGDAGRVRVQVPASWQEERRAAELARSGYRALADERYQAAIEHLERAQRLAPERTDIRNNLALAYWQSGDRGQALTTLIEGLRAHPGDRRMAQNLAHFLVKAGDNRYRSNGARVLATALKQQDRMSLYALLGNLYRHMGRPEEAVSVYRSGIARKGAHWRLLLGLGLALEDSGRTASARQVYQRARQGLPEGQERIRASLDARLEALAAAGD